MSHLIFKYMYVSIFCAVLVGFCEGTASEETRMNHANQIWRGFLKQNMNSLPTTLSSNLSCQNQIDQFFLLHEFP